MGPKKQGTGSPSGLGSARVQITSIQEGGSRAYSPLGGGWAVSTLW